jgi:hypothetical protein
VGFVFTVTAMRSPGDPMDELLKPVMPNFPAWFNAIRKINPEWWYFDEDFLRWAHKVCPLLFIGGEETNQTVDMMHQAFRAGKAKGMNSVEPDKTW